MDTKNFCWSVGVLAAMGLAGCAADDLAGNESAEKVVDVAPVGTVLEVPSDDVYVTVRPDFRRCARPRCGGFFVKAVNGGELRCADGKSAAECYVGEIDLAPTLLDDSQVKRVLGAARTEPGKVVLRGELSTTFDDDFGAYGVLSVSEAWLGQLDLEAKGTFARVTDTGIVCVAAPCPTMHESVLNGDFDQDIAGLQWQRATTEERTAALKALRTPQGILVAADEYTVTGPAGEAPGLVASQYYVQERARLLNAGCYVGGCSSQLCTDEPNAVSTCEYQPQYACYAVNSTCTRQPDGACGWTVTPELYECLLDPPTWR